MPRLQDFEGDWTLMRHIKDGRGGQHGHLVGDARLTPDQEGLIYAEQGQLTLIGQASVRAQRIYLWRPAAQERIAILFEDARPFHDFASGDPVSQVRHDCPPDLYLGRYDFCRWPLWQVEWRVTGPRKDYRMLSLYRPAAPAKPKKPAG